MYAIIKASGKQHTVRKGDVLVLDRFDAETGSTATFDVLAHGNGDSFTLGTPLVKGASVKAEVLEHGKGEKITIFKKKRRQNYRRKNGFRALQTVVRINDISAA